jgi:hypothetical protein
VPSGHKARASGEPIEWHTTFLICRYFVKETRGIVKEAVSILALAAETERKLLKSFAGQDQVDRRAACLSRPAGNS